MRPLRNASWMQVQLVEMLAGRRGHFRMESGYHSEQWFRLDPLFSNRDRLKPFVAELARRLAIHRIDAVCGPMTGGAKLAEMIGAELGVENYFTERRVIAAATGLFPVEYSLPSVQRESVRGKTIAIVDDAISAGSAVRGTYFDLLACGARPVVFGALFIFGDAAVRFTREHALSLESIAQTSFSMWLPAECPLCRAGIPLEHVSDAP